MCFSLITSYGEHQEHWQTLRTVARLATQVVKSTKVQLSLSSYEGLSAKDNERQRRAGEGASIYQLTLTS